MLSAWVEHNFGVCNYRILPYSFFCFIEGLRSHGHKDRTSSVVIATKFRHFSYTPSDASVYCSVQVQMQHDSNLSFDASNGEEMMDTVLHMQHHVL